LCFSPAFHFWVAQILLVVIPANAGIRSTMMCEARNTQVLCASHGVFNWIPAFAGMTSLRFVA